MADAHTDSIRPLETTGEPDPWRNRIPLDERGGAPYADLIETTRRLQNALAAANPPTEVAGEAADRLREAAALLESSDSPESEAPIGKRPDLTGRGHPLLLPLIVDEWTDEVVRGRVVFTRYYLGGNGAAH